MGNLNRHEGHEVPPAMNLLHEQPVLAEAQQTVEVPTVDLRLNVRDLLAKRNDALIAAGRETL